MCGIYKKGIEYSCCKDKKGKLTNFILLQDKKKLTMLASQTCNSTTTIESFLEITSKRQFKLAASSSLKVVTSEC